MNGRPYFTLTRKTSQVTSLRGRILALRAATHSFDDGAEYDGEDYRYYPNDEPHNDEPHMHYGDGGEDPFLADIPPFNVFFDVGEDKYEIDNAKKMKHPPRVLTYGALHRERETLTSSTRGDDESAWDDLPPPPSLSPPDAPPVSSSSSCSVETTRLANESQSEAHSTGPWVSRQRHLLRSYTRVVNDEVCVTTSEGNESLDLHTAFGGAQEEVRDPRETSQGQVGEPYGEQSNGDNGWRNNEDHNFSEAFESLISLNMGPMRRKRRMRHPAMCGSTGTGRERVLRSSPEALEAAGCHSSCPVTGLSSCSWVCRGVMGLGKYVDTNGCSATKGVRVRGLPVPWWMRDRDKNVARWRNGVDVTSLHRQALATTARQRSLLLNRQSSLSSSLRRTHLIHDAICRGG